MQWAGTGVIWSFAAGVPVSGLLGGDSKKQQSIVWLTDGVPIQLGPNRSEYRVLIPWDRPPGLSETGQRPVSGDWPFVP